MEIKRIINATPHDIRIGNVTFPVMPSMPAAKVGEIHSNSRHVHVGGCEVEIVDKQYDGLEGLPPEQEGIYYIVPAMVAFYDYLTSQTPRQDLLTVSDVIRNQNGRKMGAKSLARLNFDNLGVTKHEEVLVATN